MAEEINLNNLKPIEVGGLDFSEYEGHKKKIEEIEILDMPSQFTKTGKTKVLKVITEPVTEVTSKEGKKTEIRASELFNLKQDEKSGSWGYSTSSKSRLQKLMVKCKCSKPSDLKGKFVIIKVRPVTRPDGTTSEFLGFVID